LLVLGASDFYGELITEVVVDEELACYVMIHFDVNYILILSFAGCSVRV
jgi:hypothetical protein